MIKYVFTHFGPHLEEIMAYLVLLLQQGKVLPISKDIKLKYLLDASVIPFKPEGVEWSECLFLGIANKLKEKLIALGVPARQIVDEHSGSSRDADSSFRKMLKLLNFSENIFLCRWADALGYKDSGKGGDNFTFYRTLTAVYHQEKARGGCDESVAWASEISRAALQCGDYFSKGEKKVLAGKFFERLACAWLYCRAEGEKREAALDKFFSPGWETRPISFREHLEITGKKDDQRLSQIIRIVENGSQRSLGPLGLPCLLYAHYEKHNLDRTARAAFKALDAERRKQENYLQAVEIVKQAPKVYLKDKRLFALIVQSDNDQINGASRAVFGNQVALTFQECLQPKRSLHIFGNATVGASLSRLFQAILLEETRCETEISQRQQNRAGIDIAEKWHFLEDNTHIGLNGSDSYPGTPSSKIKTSWFEDHFAELVDLPEDISYDKVA